MILNNLCSKHSQHHLSTYSKTQLSKLYFATPISYNMHFYLDTLPQQSLITCCLHLSSSLTFHPAMNISLITSLSATTKFIQYCYNFSSATDSWMSLQYLVLWITSAGVNLVAVWYSSVLLLCPDAFSLVIKPPISTSTCWRHWSSLDISFLKIAPRLVGYSSTWLQLCHRYWTSRTNYQFHWLYLLNSKWAPLIGASLQCQQ